MTPPRPPRVDAWDRPLSRRDLLKVAGLVGSLAAAAAITGACAPRREMTARASASTGTSGISPGPVTMIAGGADPMAEAPLRKVFDDFQALHPGVEWDIRPIPGGGP